MMLPTLSPPDTQETIAAIARLLHHAAEGTARQAAQEGPRSALHLIGMDVQLAAAETALLVSRELDPYWPRPTQQNPRELLRIAEQLARTVPVDEATTGFSTIVVAIGDLLREADS